MKLLQPVISLSIMSQLSRKMNKNMSWINLEFYHQHPFVFFHFYVQKKERKLGADGEEKRKTQKSVGKTKPTRIKNNKRDGGSVSLRVVLKISRGMTGQALFLAHALGDGS